jgi:hypothetical protein
MSVTCWGKTFRGDGSTTQTNPVPFTVPGLTGVKAIASGATFSCALTGTGGVKCWGALRMSASSDSSFVPVDIPGLTSGVKAIAAGQFHACALTVGGGVKCWGGDNQYGELGNGTVNGRVWPPSDVVGLTSGVTAIAAGGHFTCALTTQGGVKCWVGTGPTAPRWRSVTMVRTGRWHQPDPGFAGSGRLLLPVGEGEWDPFRAGYGGNPPRRAFECAVCGERKSRGDWSGAAWRGFAMCSECARTTVTVTFHATWTERLSRDVAFAEGDEVVVEENPLAVTRVEGGEVTLAVWLSGRSA